MDGKALNELKTAIESARLIAAQQGEFRDAEIANYVMGLYPHLCGREALNLMKLALSFLIRKQPRICFDTGDFSLEPWMPDYQGPLTATIDGRAVPLTQLPPDQVVRFGLHLKARAVGTAERANKDLHEAEDVIRAGRAALPYVAGDPKATLGEGLEARKRYLKSEAAERRHRKAQKAGAAGGRGRTKNQ